MSAPDPLDLPIFNPPAQGRVRSGFEFHPDAGTLPVSSASTSRTHGGLRSVPAPEWATTVVAAGQVSRGSTPSAAPLAAMDWALVARLRVQVARRLADAMGEARWDREAQEAHGRDLIDTVLAEESADMLRDTGQVRPAAEVDALARAVFDACFGLGRLQPLVDDPAIENIMITGADQVVVERSDGSLHRMPPVADSDEELADFLAFLASRADNPRSFTPSQPSLHLTLPGGARLAAALDTARVSVVIRRHRVRQVTLGDLVAWGTITPTVASFLAAAVRARLSIVVSGAQGVGKTTLLRALCAEIDPAEVIGTFETEYELFLHEMPEQHHTVHAWEAREGSGERAADGRQAGSRTIDQQIIDSFRFRLDRQIQGEIRGPEVWSMVKLMESGSGSISTTHAASAHQTMRKLITCAMEAGPQVSQELAATKLADTIDLVVQLGCIIVRDDRHREGRKIRYVEEILHISPGERPRGYAATVVFGRRPGRCAVATTRPDELMELLVGHGFDVAGFEAEMARFGGVL